MALRATLWSDEGLRKTDVMEERLERQRTEKEEKAKG